MTEQTDLRALDRALAEALGWRAEATWHSGPDKRPLYELLSPDGNTMSNAGVWESAEMAWADCPPFSANTPEGREAMWGVIERMRELGWYWTLRGGPERDDYVEFWHRESNDRVGTGLGTTLPEAVARAALAALRRAQEATDGN